jgi:HEAT repeat protein
MLITIFMLQRDYIAQLATNLIDGADEQNASGGLGDKSGQTDTILERNRLLKDIESYRRNLASAEAEQRSERAASGQGAGVAHPPAGLVHDKNNDLEVITQLHDDNEDVVRQALIAQRASSLTLPHILPMLRSTALLRESLHALAPLSTTACGQLADALLDRHQHPLVRRRVPLLLARSDSKLAVLALILGLDDNELDVRFRCAEALGQLLTNHPHLRSAIDPSVIDNIVYREMHRLKAAGYREQQGVVPLKHLFNLFAVIVGRDVMDICYEALDSGDVHTRGTALEYLENQLPPDIRLELWPLIAPEKAPTESTRSEADIVRDLEKATGHKINKADNKTGNNQ